MFPAQTSFVLWWKELERAGEISASSRPAQNLQKETGCQQNGYVSLSAVVGPLSALKFQLATGKLNASGFFFTFHLQ